MPIELEGNGAPLYLNNIPKIRAAINYARRGPLTETHWKAVARFILEKKQEFKQLNNESKVLNPHQYAARLYGQLFQQHTLKAFSEQTNTDPNKFIPMVAALIQYGMSLPDDFTADNLAKGLENASPMSPRQATENRSSLYILNRTVMDRIVYPTLLTGALNYAIGSPTVLPLTTPLLPTVANLVGPHIFSPLEWATMLPREPEIPLPSIIVQPIVNAVLPRVGRAVASALTPFFNSFLKKSQTIGKAIADEVSHMGSAFVEASEDYNDALHCDDRSAKFKPLSQ